MNAPMALSLRNPPLFPIILSMRASMISTTTRSRTSMKPFFSKLLFSSRRRILISWKHLCSESWNKNWERLADKNLWYLIYVLTFPSPKVKLAIPKKIFKKNQIRKYRISITSAEHLLIPCQCWRTRCKKWKKRILELSHQKGISVVSP